MAKKKCPKCEQTLPVACKSCPCGHVFMAKKHSSSKYTEGKKKKISSSSVRLQPERPKREISKQYRDGFGRQDIQMASFSKKMKLIDDHNFVDDDDVFLFDNSELQGTDSMELGESHVKRKRGRPKGSKNKRKDDKNLLVEFSEENEDNGECKSGKNNSGRRETCELPPIPEDKILAYNLILSDINERLMSQNKIKCLSGL